MANVFKCDICGKETLLYPPFKHKTNKVTMDGATVEVPATKKVKRQNFHTGKIEIVEVPDVEYIKPPTIIVKLQVAGEEIQKDFCEDCVKKIKGNIDALWDVLEGIDSK